MKVRYDLVVDFARPNKSNTLIIAEGDRNSRLLHFTLLANKQPMDMIDVSVATVKGIKADGSVIYGDATIITDEYDNKLNEIEYTLPENFSDLANKVTMTVTLMANDGSQITSFEYYVEVRNALYSEDDYISEEDLKGFRDLLNRCMAALEKMEQMVEADALPCPYPMNIILDDDEEYNYNGSVQKDIDLSNIAYTADEPILDEDDIDESAAGIAVEAANQAGDSERRAAESAAWADISKMDAEVAAEKSASKAEESRNNAGMCSAYMTQTQEIADAFSQDIGNINGRIQTLWDAVFPQN